MKRVEVVLTQGNINNDHLYLAEVIGFFPACAIGGSNKHDAASLNLEIHCGIDNPVHTDIAGDKKIFRKRAWVGEFFAAHELKAGDRVVIEKTARNRYHIYPCRGS